MFPSPCRLKKVMFLDYLYICVPAFSIVAREIAMDQARSLYEFTLLKHINTKDNLIADALSRQFEPIPAPFPELGNCVRNPVQVDSGFWQVPR